MKGAESRGSDLSYFLAVVGQPSLFTDLYALLRTRAAPPLCWDSNDPCKGSNEFDAEQISKQKYQASGAFTKQCNS